MEPVWTKTCGCKFALTSRTIIQPNGGTREVPCYVLNKTECLYIATKFNDEARAKLVLRWEELERTMINQTTPGPIPEQSSPTRSLSSEGGEYPIVINSGYRSPQLNKLVGGVATSNHVTGCAVDIRCSGAEQAITFAYILLDYAKESQSEFDELFIEKNKYGRYWVHFAVRPSDNRRKVSFLNG